MSTRRPTILALLASLLHGCAAHGRMVEPPPRQPESLYWYQVGCMIGCMCSGGGKENYPSLASGNVHAALLLVVIAFPDITRPCDCILDPLCVWCTVGCSSPETPALPKKYATFNADDTSPMGAWNKYMPWRFPGRAKPLNSCGVASGFVPTAAVQFAHQFSASSGVTQGMHGTSLPAGPLTTWEASAVVEASFTLVVNHGGGYQYRACRVDAAASPDEDCFEANPLRFADSQHTVRFSEAAGGGEVVIGAVDVDVGVHPAGAAWRRLPLPACNCDSGYYCGTAGSAQSGKTTSAASTAYAAGQKAHGECTTGLQFEASHLSSTWTEGYGYYVASLGKTTRAGKAGDGSSKAAGDDGIAGAGEKSGTCAAIKSEAECIASSAGCLWHSSAAKTVCYDKGVAKRRRLQQTGDFSGAGAQDEEAPRWKIVDRLIAPPIPGQYLLQWRWDNDQTPQIWTTCADVAVIEPTVKWWAIVLIALGGAAVVVTFVVALVRVRRKMSGRSSRSGAGVPMTGVPKV